MIWISWKAAILWKVWCELNFLKNARRHIIHTGWLGRYWTNAWTRSVLSAGVSEKLHSQSLEVLLTDSSSTYWQQFCLLTAVLLTDNSSTYWQQFCLLTALLLTDSSSAYWQQFYILTAVLLTDSSSAYWQQFYVLTALMLTDSSSAYWQQFCLLTAVHIRNNSTYIDIMRRAGIAQSV